MTKKRRKHAGSTRSNPHVKFTKKQIGAIVHQIESGELTRTEACHRYGMAYCTVTDWMKRYSSNSASVPKKSTAHPSTAAAGSQRHYGRQDDCQGSTGSLQYLPSGHGQKMDKSTKATKQ